MYQSAPTGTTAAISQETQQLRASAQGSQGRTEGVPLTHPAPAPCETAGALAAESAQQGAPMAMKITLRRMTGLSTAAPPSTTITTCAPPPRAARRHTAWCSPVVCNVLAGFRVSPLTAGSPGPLVRANRATSPGLPCQTTPRRVRESPAARPPCRQLKQQQTNFDHQLIK